MHLGPSGPPAPAESRVRPPRPFLSWSGRPGRTSLPSCRGPGPGVPQSRRCLGPGPPAVPSPCPAGAPLRRAAPGLGSRQEVAAPGGREPRGINSPAQACGLYLVGFPRREWEKGGCPGPASPSSPPLASPPHALAQTCRGAAGAHPGWWAELASLPPHLPACGQTRWGLGLPTGKWVDKAPTFLVGQACGRRCVEAEGVWGAREVGVAPRLGGLCLASG